MNTDAGMDKLRQLAVKFRDLRALKDEQEAALTELNKQLEDISRVQIPELMAELELKNATFIGVGRVQLAGDIFMHTRDGRKGDAIQWLRDCGYEGMVTETYNASTLKALFRRLLTDGAEIPEDIFSVVPYTRASLVKA